MRRAALTGVEKLAVTCVIPAGAFATYQTSALIRVDGLSATARVHVSDPLLSVTPVIEPEALPLPPSIVTESRSRSPAFVDAGDTDALVPAAPAALSTS